MEEIAGILFIAFLVFLYGSERQKSLREWKKKNQNYPELVVIVRHGQSVRNKVYADARKVNAPSFNGVFLPEVEDLPGNKDLLFIKDMSDPEIPLTERGRRQALITGKFIKEKYGDFDVVYDSGYVRTIETRKNLMEAYAEESYHAKIISHHLVREREPGYCFNMTKKEAEQNFPFQHDHWRRFGSFLCRPPGGKSQADVCDQVALFMRKECHKLAGKKVLIISHGGTINAFRHNLENWTMEEYLKNCKPAPKNCGVTTYRYDEQTKSLKLEEYNKVYWTKEEVADVE